MRPTIRNRLALAAALCAAVSCGGSSGGTDPGTPPPNTVDVFTPGNVFSPFSATVPAGGTVRFNISGAQHNVIFDHTIVGAPDDVPVTTNGVVSRTFTTKGTYGYDCTVHPGMSGQIIVQ